MLAHYASRKQQKNYPTTNQDQNRTEHQKNDARIKAPNYRHARTYQLGRSQAKGKNAINIQLELQQRGACVHKPQGVGNRAKKRYNKNSQPTEIRSKQYKRFSYKNIIALHQIT